uniref:ATP synthase subunit a n=1 Tax=Myrsidea sp. ADS-2020 TaxID=2794901 RepID=A0A7T1M884_9NEOP|nr:ATP synthase F0 subunit 6 [Myrsidea sp. ADS-2020]
MTSLMSIFDPSMSIHYLGWSGMLLGVLVFKNVFWKVSSLVLLLLELVIHLLLKLYKSQSTLFVALFLFIMNMNLVGLLPLVFSPTSHLSFNITLSLILWLGMLLWYWLNNSSQFLSHLTPLGSPLVLSPVLVLIELISNLIRPLTLSLRLMANIMAGHMILTLISKGVFNLSIVVSAPLFVILVGFTMFEFGVALIQSYVFTSLMALYWEESDKMSH